MATQYILPSPDIDPENKPYFDAANEGRLLLKHCRACDRTHYYPRAICPFCFSSETEWREASGDGEIHTFSVMRLGPQPYAVAFVTLPEGPRMLVGLTDCDVDALAIGDTVRLTFRQAGSGQSIPFFTTV